MPSFRVRCLVLHFYDVPVLLPEDCSIDNDYNLGIMAGLHTDMKEEFVMRKEQRHQFECRTCGELSIAPPLGTPDNQRWRQAWVDEGRIACCECLGVFCHQTLTIIEELAHENNHHARSEP